MTTGSWFAGDNANLTTTRFRAKKFWSGDDGKYETSRVSRKVKWNGYVMAHLNYQSKGSDLGLINKSNGSYQLRDNSVINGADNIVPNGTFPSSLFNSYWTSSQELALQASILNKAKGSSFNVGVSLAEVDKLAGTVLGTVKTIGLGVNDLLNHRFSDFARRFGTSPPSAKKVKELRTLDISGRFLEMQYAWKPAINDVYNASQAFEALSNGPRQQTFRASRAAKDEFTSDDLGNYQKVKVSYQIKRSYTYEMYEEMAAYRQMGLANPLSIVWERLPWSFVLDWFIPIGSYLELIGQIPFMKGRWMVTSSVRAKYTLLPELNSGIGLYNTISPPVASSVASAFWMSRSVSFQPPPVPFPTVQVEGAIQGQRIGNALALAHQLFSKAASAFLG